MIRIIIIRSWFGSLKSTPLNQRPPVVGKGGSSYANEMRISLNLTHPQPLWKDRGGIDVSGEKGGQDKIRYEKWQGIKATHGQRRRPKFR